MGVKQCSGYKCENIMCDIRIEEVGYVCGECYEIIKSRLDQVVTSKSTLISKVQNMLDNMPDYKTSSRLKDITYFDND